MADRAVFPPDLAVLRKTRREPAAILKKLAPIPQLHVNPQLSFKYLYAILYLYPFINPVPLQVSHGLETTIKPLWVFLFIFRFPLPLHWGQGS